MIKPEINEIINYLTAEKNYDDFTAQGFATQFWHHYESNGWKVGRNQMKSWKSAIVTWEQNNLKYGNNRKTPSESKRGTSEARIDRAKRW